MNRRAALSTLAALAAAPWLPKPARPIAPPMMLDEPFYSPAILRGCTYPEWKAAVRDCERRLDMCYYALWEAQLPRS